MNLRDYQIRISDEACRILTENGLVYLAMETRTGKTITAFETVSKYGAKNVLFVTKKKALGTVNADYEHYKSRFRCWITNYESVSKCPEIPDLVIVDESHSCGAFSKPAKRVKDLLKYTKNVPIIFMSATPTPESYSQLYHQFYLSSRTPFAQWKNFYKWAKEFVTVKKQHYYNREINDYSDADKELIDKFTRHLFITQTQVDSGFEFLIEEKVLTCGMTDKQREIINRLKKDKIVTGASGAVILADTAVKLQSKIHQLCSGTVIDEEGQGHIISYTKADFIKEKFAGQRIAVFYKFKAELQMLSEVFDGDWTDVPELFQSGEGRVFLGQFQSSREGIRLDEAEAVVFMNIDFSYLSYAQAKERIVSKERTRKAVLYWVFSVGGIERKIYHVVQRKQDYTSYHFRKDVREIGVIEERQMEMSI